MISEVELRDISPSNLLADVSQVCATDQVYLSGVPADDYELYVSGVLAPEWEATEELTRPSLISHQHPSLPFADIGSVELTLDDGEVFQRD